MKFSTYSAYFLLCGLLLIWQGTKAAEVRCFPEVHCEGELIQTVFTPRECCIENAIGVSYDYSGQIEKCHTCEEVKVRLPTYNSSDRYTAKNTTLRMAKRLPASLGEAQFIYPEEVTLHVIVPAVSIERSSYSIEYSENLAVTVCLSYDNTGGGHAQFSVNVSVTGQDGGFSKTHKFDFTALSGRSCDSVSLPLSAIHDPFTDTVFSVAIVHQDQSPFDLGPNSSVSLTVKALIDMGSTALSEIIAVVFVENSTKSCLTTTLTLPEQRPQRLTLTIVSTFNISPFELPKFRVGGRRNTVIMVEEEPQPTLESVGTPEGGREEEGEGEKGGEEEEEGEEEVATGTRAAEVRCFPEVHCEGELIQTVFTPRECCIENAIGVSYDYSGQIERCHTCEVLGWKQAHVYAIEDSVISIPFGANRVPEVSFESSSYRADVTENLAVPVCLYYDNTGEVTLSSASIYRWPQKVKILFLCTFWCVPRDEWRCGGFFKTFDFTALSGRSCDSVSLPRSAVHDPFTDTVFSVAIVHQDQPPFDLGPHSSASLIINALKVPEVQFEESQTTYTLPVTSIETCLVRTPPDEMDSTLPLTVNVSLSRDMGSTALSEIIAVVFVENSTKSCLTTTLTLPEQRPQRLTLTIVSTFNISAFELPKFRVGGRRNTVIMVEEEPQPTLGSVGTPEGGREEEGEGEEGEEEVATGSGDDIELDIVGDACLRRGQILESQTLIRRDSSSGAAADPLTGTSAATSPRAVAEDLAETTCRPLRNAAEEWGCRTATETAAEIVTANFRIQITSDDPLEPADVLVTYDGNEEGTRVVVEPGETESVEVEFLSGEIGIGDRDRAVVVRSLNGASVSKGC
ncbi:hypothetical protein GBAR_LOCUS24599 [Geodia barretti]|uniref:Uncharacterized protein n=1 Tax=Geodia barretti TaxID=519541 RepID=A0AA35T9S0_GEOBA|nr:hypothetical protein GBAR_LOCUS24599 [Geodia barretti]